MSYRLLEHATDAVVEVDAPDMGGAFAAAAMAVSGITLDAGSVAQREERRIEASGPDMRHLLYAWLEAAIYEIITGGFAIGRVEASVSRAGGLSASGTARGEPLDLARHGFRVEIKAPTFHEMRVSEGPGGASLRFLLDL